MPASAAYLHRSAYTGGVDGRWRFTRTLRGLGLARPEPGGRRRRGDRADPAGSGAPLPAPGRPAGRSTPTRTSLSGSNQEIRFAKVGGRRLHFETAYQRRTPGFEINDIGFLRQADQQAWTSWANLAVQHAQPGLPAAPVELQQLGILDRRGAAHRAGLQHQRAHPVHQPLVAAHRAARWASSGTTYCDRCARGGPAVRQDPYSRPWITIEGTTAARWCRSLSANYSCGDQGRSETIDVTPELDLKVSTRFTTSLSASYNHNRNDIQYFGTFTDPGGELHYTFAHLEQQTLSLTWRLGYTFTPTPRSRCTPRPSSPRGPTATCARSADARAERVRRPLPALRRSCRRRRSGRVQLPAVPLQRGVPLGVPAGLDAVPGLEPGAGGIGAGGGHRSFRGDLGDLFGRRANDTFLVKVSYWLAR